MRILLIDDDKDCLAVMKKFLEFGGFECDAFTDPIEALACFKIENFDVVITDIMMPEVKGIEVLRKVKAHNPGTFVIITTGYADLDNAVNAVNEGAYAFFRKPIELKKVIEKIQQIEKEKNFTFNKQNLELSLVKLLQDYKELEDSYKRKDGMERNLSRESEC